jgi:hypothetical protein
MSDARKSPIMPVAHALEMLLCEPCDIGLAELAIEANQHEQGFRRIPITLRQPSGLAGGRMAERPNDLTSTKTGSEIVGDDTTKQGGLSALTNVDPGQGFNPCRPGEWTSRVDLDGVVDPGGSEKRRKISVWLRI